MVADNERSACAAVRRMEVCWMPHGRSCWALAQAADTPAISNSVSFQACKEIFGLKDGKRQYARPGCVEHALLSFGSFAPKQNSPSPHRLGLSH